MATTLTLQFKQKHFGYCAQFMMNVVMNQFFYLASSVRAALQAAGAYNAEGMVTINIAPTDLVTLYAQLGEKQEKMAASMNADLKTTLLPQLTTISQGTTDQAPLAQSVLAQLSTLDTQNQNEVAGIVTAGINWLTEQQ